MRVRDPKEAIGVILSVDDDVLRASRPLSIANDNYSNLIYCGIRKVVAPVVTVLIKVKRYCELLIRRHGNGHLKGLSVKGNSRMDLIKDALKQIQGCGIKGILLIVLIMPSQAMLKSIICVMNVELGICERSILERKDRASIMDELSTQDIGVRATTTLIDRRDSCFANRSHSQGIVVKKDALVKGRTNWIIADEEIVEIMWDVMKRRKRDSALIATHAKLESGVRRGREGFSFPMKSMARKAFNIHFSKAVNLPSRIKRTACNGKLQNWLQLRHMINSRCLWKWWNVKDMIK
jgi:hypothetical protein